MKVAQKLLHAYIAGLVDGEGTISIVRHKAEKKRKIAEHFGVHNSIANTCLEVLLLVQDEFGGSVYNHPDKRGFQMCYVWYLSRKDTKNFLEAMLPYLVIKRQQAKLALKFLAAFPKLTRGQRIPDAVQEQRQAYYLEMRKLNHTLK